MTWKRIPLGELSVERGGSVDPSKFPDETFELFSIPAFDKGISEVLSGKEIGSSKKCIQPNDVLISRIVPHIRRSWVVPPKNGYRQIASGEWIQFRSEHLYPNFLRHFLVSDPFHQKFMKTVSGVGGSLLRARPKEVYKLKLPLPPLEEQKRIARILDTADEIRTKRRQSIEELDRLAQSIFLDVFGDPATNPRNYPIKSLTEFYINMKDGTKCGPFGSALKKKELVDTGVPVWNMDNIDPRGRMMLPFRMWITNEKFEELKAYSIKDGDILISRAGTVGKMCVAKTDNFKSIINTNLIRLRLNSQLLPVYFVSLMTFFSDRVGRLKTGSDESFTHMSTKVLNSINIPYPPIKSQKKFATIIQSIEAQKSHLQKHLVELDNLFASLQSRAFNGKM